MYFSKSAMNLEMESWICKMVWSKPSAVARIVQNSVHLVVVETNWTVIFEAKSCHRFYENWVPGWKTVGDATHARELYWG